MSFLVLSSGCGKLRDQRAGVSLKNIFKGIGGLEEPTQHSLTATEILIATHICTSLQTKRNSLITHAGSIAYTFNVQRNDCNNKSTETSKQTFPIVLAGTDLEYSTTINYITDVVTEKTSALSAICKVMLDAGNTAKDVSNSNIVGDKLFTVAFLVSADKYETVQITTRLKDSKGSFNPLNSEEIKIATDASQLGAKYVGVEKVRIQNTPCSGTQVSTLQETWVGSIP